MIATGIDGLLTSLAALGVDNRLTLPGVDEPVPAADYMRRCLALMRDREIPFDMAWNSTINRIQAPQAEGGMIADESIGALVVEERALLEEDRTYWRAAYEQREPTTMERAQSRVRTWQRIDDGVMAAKLARRGVGLSTARRAA